MSFGSLLTYVIGLELTNLSTSANKADNCKADDQSDWIAWVFSFGFIVRYRALLTDLPNFHELLPSEDSPGVETSK